MGGHGRLSPLRVAGLDCLTHGGVLSHRNGAVHVCRVEPEGVQVAVRLGKGVADHRVAGRGQDGVVEAGVVGHQILPQVLASLHGIPEARQFLFQRPGRIGQAVHRGRTRCPGFHRSLNSNSERSSGRSRSGVVL